MSTKRTPGRPKQLLSEFQLDGVDVRGAVSPGVKATREQLDGDKPLAAVKITQW